MPGQNNAWLKAIENDGLTWRHVSDLKGWDNEAAKLYGVKSVPTNFLIDTDGKIIAKHLHRGELMETLDKILK